MWYAKTRVAGRALEFWNHYENLHFRIYWSLITWERMKEDLCIVYFPQYIITRLKSQLHNFDHYGNFQDQRTSMRQCNNAPVTHEVSAVRQN